MTFDDKKNRAIWQGVLKSELISSEESGYEDGDEVMLSDCHGTPSGSVNLWLILTIKLHLISRQWLRSSFCMCLFNYRSPRMDFC